MNEIKERLAQFADSLGISKREFCRAIDVSPTFLANSSEIASDKVLNIINAFPQISLEWLISGNGGMLKDPPSEADEIITGKVIPLYDAEVAAGSAYGMDMEPTRPIGMIEIGGFLKDSESALRVYGNSMTPHYPPGCIVGTKLWTERFIEPGKVFIVETRENRFLKRLYYSADKSAIRCLSDNTMKHEAGPAAGEFCYPEFEIPLDSIIRLHRVVGVIKRNII